MVAPAFGALFIPARLRLVLAGAIAFLVAPLIPQPTGIEAFSVAGFIVTIQQVIIGVALGFALNDAVRRRRDGRPVAREQHGPVVRLQRGPDARHRHAGAGPALRTARHAHVPGARRPSRHSSRCWSTASARCRSARRASRTKASGRVVAWGTQIFSGALAVALPGITALLIVNLAFGVMSRAAPSLNLFAVGFPITLVFGLVIILVGLAGPAVRVRRICSARRSCSCARCRAGRLTPWLRHDAERTEQPTQKRLEEARKNGQIPRSTDLNAAAVVLFAGARVAFPGPRPRQRPVRHDARGLTHLARAGARSVQRHLDVRRVGAAGPARCRADSRSHAARRAARAAFDRRLESRVRHARAGLLAPVADQGLRPHLLDARARRARQGVRQVRHRRA